MNSRAKRLLAESAVIGLWFVPIALLACLLRVGALLVADALPIRLRGPWAGWGLNIAPALVVGFVTFALVARRMRSATNLPTTLIIRPAVLYAVVIVLGWSIWTYWSVPGFGLVAQLYAWPCLAAIGGIAAIMVQSIRRGHHVV